MTKVDDVVIGILIKIYDEDYPNIDELALYLVDICLKKKEVFYNELEQYFKNVLNIPMIYEKFNVYFEYYVEDSIDELYNLFSLFSNMENIEKTSILGLFMRNLLLNIHELMFEEYLVSNLFLKLNKWKEIRRVEKRKDKNDHFDFEIEKKYIFERNEIEKSNEYLLNLPELYFKYDNDEFYKQSKKESLNISYQKNDATLISILNKNTNDEEEEEYNSYLFSKQQEENKLKSLTLNERKGNKLLIQFNQQSIFLKNNSFFKSKLLDFNLQEGKVDNKNYHHSNKMNQLQMKNNYLNESKYLFFQKNEIEKSFYLAKTLFQNEVHLIKKLESLLLMIEILIKSNPTSALSYIEFGLKESQNKFELFYYRFILFKIELNFILENEVKYCLPIQFLLQNGMSQDKGKMFLLMSKIQDEKINTAKYLNLAKVEFETTHSSYYLNEIKLFQLSLEVE
eukprot:gene8855-804_t